MVSVGTVKGRMAEIKEVTPEACAAATKENARRLFGVG